MEAFQSKENLEEQREAVRQEIYAMLKEYHDVSLVKRGEAPGANTIYHLYQNGNITFQKGGHAYLERSEFDLSPSISKNLKLDIENFGRSIQYSSWGRMITVRFAIVTCENAILIRNKMLDLEKLM
jgi:hypothetical protein